MQVIRKILPLLLCAILVTGMLSACGSAGTSANRDKKAEKEENTFSARRQGYDKGYSCGHKDGHENYVPRSNYDDSGPFKSYDGRVAYMNGYKEGYEEGYTAGETQRREEFLDKVSDWDKRDIKGVYVYLDEAHDADTASYLAQEYYEGEYICEDGRYYAKIIDRNNCGKDIKLGKQVTPRLYRIHGTDLFIRFHEDPGLEEGIAGLVDASEPSGAFYLKPGA